MMAMTTTISINEKAGEKTRECRGREISTEKNRVDPPNNAQAVPTHRNHRNPLSLAILPECHRGGQETCLERAM
jgi:hypothetical protein